VWPGGFGAPVGSWSLRGDGAEHVDASGPAAGQDGGGQAGDRVGSVYVTYYPDLAVDGAAEAVGTFADLAVATGARRLVLLSGRADDIADVAVAALSGARHVGQLYEVTGPRLLSWSDAVAEIATAVGHPIRYLPVSLEDYGSLLIENQVPADYVKMLTDVFTEVLDGRNAHLADGVQRALGRPPRDFADFARDAAATGIWDSR
jgi:uncharacterized protein YbjT (DUF2867 family)